MPFLYATISLVICTYWSILNSAFCQHWPAFDQNHIRIISIQPASKGGLVTSTLVCIGPNLWYVSREMILCYLFSYLYTNMYIYFVYIMLIKAHCWQLCYYLNKIQILWNHSYSWGAMFVDCQNFAGSWWR